MPAMEGLAALDVAAEQPQPAVPRDAQRGVLAVRLVVRSLVQHAAAGGAARLPQPADSLALGAAPREAEQAEHHCPEVSGPSAAGTVAASSRRYPPSGHRPMRWQRHRSRDRLVE